MHTLEECFLVINMSQAVTNNMLRYLIWDPCLCYGVRALLRNSPKGMRLQHGFQLGRADWGTYGTIPGPEGDLSLSFNPLQMRDNLSRFLYACFEVCRQGNAREVRVEEN